MGFVPHRTRNIYGDDECNRISYSCYTKPQYEHLGLVTLALSNDRYFAEARKALVKRLRDRTREEMLKNKNKKRKW